MLLKRPSCIESLAFNTPFMTSKEEYNTLIINIMICVVCGGIQYILGYYITLFIPKIGSKIDCVVYTVMYNFMKEIPVYMFRCEKSLFILIYDVL